MRDILFRGKDNGVLNNQWQLGSIDSTDDNFPKIIRHDRWGNKMYINVERDTVGQFTGLTDKNGKKIFEGDIVVCQKEISGNWIDSCVEIGFVEMKHGAFGLHRKQGYYRPFKDWLEDYEYEVIGNIYDNPEMLEAE